VSKPDFQGLNVLVLESRRSREMAALVTTYGGRPVVAPALREVPIESNTKALAFADALIRGEFDVVVLLTGVGTRALLDVVSEAGRREAFVAALGRTKVAVRGPKPLGVIRCEGKGGTGCCQTTGFSIVGVGITCQPDGAEEHYNSRRGKRFFPSEPRIPPRSFPDEGYEFCNRQDLDSHKEK
jgi:hypothetical protein